MHSVETTRVKASSAAFEATYAEKRGGLVCTPIEETFITCPSCALAHVAQQAMISSIVPK